MIAPRDFRKLQLWQKSHELVLMVYRHTQTFPQHEMFGLTSQMRRSAVSMPSNIAEGCGRAGETELSRFLNIARGSASELAYQCILAGDLEYLMQDVSKQLEQRADEVSRMMTAYSQSLTQRPN